MPCGGGAAGGEHDHGHSHAEGETSCGECDDHGHSHAAPAPRSSSLAAPPPLNPFGAQPKRHDDAVRRTHPHAAPPHPRLHPRPRVPCTGAAPLFAANGIMRLLNALHRLQPAGWNPLGRRCQPL